MSDYNKNKQVEPKKVDLTHEALGTYKDPKSGEWYVTLVKYNPETGETGDFSKIPAGGSSKDFAVEEFKLQAFRREIVG